MCVMFFTKLSHLPSQFCSLIHFFQSETNFQAFENRNKFCNLILFKILVMLVTCYGLKTFELYRFRYVFFLNLNNMVVLHFLDF